MITEGTWEALDQTETTMIVRIVCEIEEKEQVLEVGQSWSLSNLRQEIMMCLGVDAERDFTMWIVRQGAAMEKVYFYFSISFHFMDF